MCWPGSPACAQHPPSPPTPNPKSGAAGATPAASAAAITSAFRYPLPHRVAQVFTEFLAQCERGLSPNPDLACNRHIKFDALLQFAGLLGAELGEREDVGKGAGWWWLPGMQ